MLMINWLLLKDICTNVCTDICGKITFKKIYIYTKSHGKLKFCKLQHYHINLLLDIFFSDDNNSACIKYAYIICIIIII